MNATVDGEVIKMELKKDKRLEKQLLTIKEVCDYLGIGQTKARNLSGGVTVLALGLVIDGMQIKRNLMTGWTEILSKAVHLHMAPYSGRVSGVKRPRCGASGHILNCSWLSFTGFIRDVKNARHNACS